MNQCIGALPSTPSIHLLKIKCDIPYILLIIILLPVSRIITKVSLFEVRLRSVNSDRTLFPMMTFHMRFDTPDLPSVNSFIDSPMVHFSLLDFLSLGYASSLSLLWGLRSDRPGDALSALHFYNVDRQSEFCRVCCHCASQGRQPILVRNIDHLSS